MPSVVNAQSNLETTDVLWVEADNEAQEGQTRNQVLRGLLAYLLLAHRLVIHPAYVWQSDATRSLVLGDVGKLLTPENSKVFLGMATDSIRAYMDARVERTAALQRSPVGGRSEYEEYIRHGKAVLAREQEELDDRFTANGAIITSTSSRDLEFRRLLRYDLVNEGRLSDRLSGLLLRDPRVPERITCENLVKLSEWTHDERLLVSGDSFLGQLVQIGNYSATTLQAIDRRVHVLHWACHVTESTRVPFIQRATDADSLDPLDPEVFWAAMRSLVGDRLCDRWLGCKEVDAVQVAVELRLTGTWTEFRHVYVNIVSAIDQLKLPLEERAVVGALQTALPSRTRIIIRRLATLPLVSTIFGTLRSVHGDLVGGSLQTGGGLAALANNVLKQLEKYNVALRDDVALHVRSALRRAIPDESLLPIKIRAEDLLR